MQIICVSQPFRYGSPTFSSILQDARRNTVGDPKTRTLLCRRDTCLKLPESHQAQVQAAFERIGRDDRTGGNEILVSDSGTDRIFGDGAMQRDPATLLIWT